MPKDLKVMMLPLNAMLTDIYGTEKHISGILIEKYLYVGKYANKLKSSTAVGIGFVEGDTNILHHS